jgi:hypothetical protein
MNVGGLMMDNNNLMEKTPQRSRNITWEESEKINLIVERTSKMDRFAQKFFKTPKSTRVELDEIGSFVWSKCDGNNTIYDISQLMEAHFGEKVNPVLERLIQYIKILVSNKFITLE